MMKLRVRIRRQTSRVDLQGPDTRVTELRAHIRERLLSPHGLSSDTEFSLSLNGSELLPDDETLSSCGIVTGDLICVLLPESEAATTSTSSTTSSNSSTSSTSTNSTIASSSRSEHRPPVATTTNQSSSPAALSQPQDPPGVPDPGVMDPSVLEPGTSVWEPMLCSEAEEGQAPLSLELLFHSAQSSSPSDAVMAAGHLLMLETGFIPQGCVRAGEMPSGWRSPGGVFRLQYSHPLCEGSVAMVVAVSMGAMLVVNATLKVNQSVDTVRKLCLDPSSFVTEQWTGDSAAAAYRDLNKLSRLFKDQLSYPLIAAAREAMSLPVAFGLAALPPELLLRVLRLLDVGSVVRLSSVCRHFRAATDDSSLWRHLYRRDFTDPEAIRSRDTDWKELYKRFYKTRAELRQAFRRSLPPLYRSPRDILDPFPLPLAPPVPGIIGGEYDQRPGLLPRHLLPRPRFDPVGPPPAPGGRPLYRLRPPDVRRAHI